MQVLDLKKLFHFVVYVKPIAYDRFHQAYNNASTNRRTTQTLRLPRI